MKEKMLNCTDVGAAYIHTLGSVKERKEKIGKKSQSNINGITLVALVVTVSILLILAGITLTYVLGDNGIIKLAQKAKEETEGGIQNEQDELEILVNILKEEYGNNIGNENGEGSGGTTNPPEQSITSDGSFSEEKGVNTPKLEEGMTPVKWDGSQWVPPTSIDDWYDYSTTAKKWANVEITKDGVKSYFVWIPRYGYQINSNYHTDSKTAGEINVKFLKGISNTPADGNSITWNNSSGEGNWNVHPAFTWGKIENGVEKSCEIPGIWVAKFEASRVDSTDENDGTIEKIKVQPGVRSWRNISVNEIYDVCKAYDEKLNSHMMKNSEWGAVSYLAQSSYGKNSEVWINPNSYFITGQAGEGESVEATETTYSYENMQYGVNASTTGTIYGIYDMNGGTYEYVAAYVNNGHSYLSNGTKLINGANYEKDVYSSAGVNAQQADYNTAKNKYGDAVYETSKTYSGASAGWYGDYVSFPNSNGPFFVRGGITTYKSMSGLFCFRLGNGVGYNHLSFRPVLVAL